MITRASASVPNISRLMHSSRSLSWKLSIYAFSHGEPGLMQRVLMCFAASQSWIAYATNSGPLSLRCAVACRACPWPQQHREHILRADRQRHMRGEALPCVLVDQRQDAERSA